MVDNKWGYNTRVQIRAKSSLLAPILEWFCWWEEYSSGVSNWEEAVFDESLVMRLTRVFVNVADMPMVRRSAASN